jgi:hypothetical protein
MRDLWMRHQGKPRENRSHQKMRAPTTRRDVKNLTGWMASLNRFFSKQVERSLPFFKASNRFISKLWSHPPLQINFRVNINKYYLVESQVTMQCDGEKVTCEVWGKRFQHQFMQVCIFHKKLYHDNRGPCGGSRLDVIFFILFFFFECFLIFFIF